MSVQASTSHAPPQGAHPAGRADGRNGRVKHQAGASEGAGETTSGPQGFMAILSSLGEMDANAAESPAADVTQDPGTPATTIDPGSLVAQTVALLAPPGDARRTNAADSLPAEGAAVGDAGSSPAAAWPVATDSKAAGARAGVPGAGEALADPGVELAGKEAARGAGLKKQDKQPVLPDAASAVAQAATQKQEPRDARMQLAMEIHKALQGSGEAVQAMASTVGREEQRSSEKSIFSLKAQDGLPTHTVNGLDPGSAAPLDVPMPIADVGAPVDVQVAEKVQYWISSDVQNAELQLDGLGDRPVEVSISLQGNEAHVSFRTDEAVARQALESAGSHLKDMLQREGITLGGVFVGQSGGQAAGRDQPRQARQGVRQMQVAPAQAQAVDNGRRSHGPAGRALDLFV